MKVLVTGLLLLALSCGAECFRVARQADTAEDSGPLSTFASTLRSYWDQTKDTANRMLESLKEYKLQEKAMEVYDETTQALKTYSGIMQDQMYHIVYHK